MPTTANRFPLMDAEDAEIRAFRDKHFQPYATYRNRHMQRAALNLYYDLGRQWIERDLNVGPDGARSFAFRDLAPTAEVELPRPVTNYVAPAIDVEFSTLSKRQWVPKVVTSTRDPRAEAAVKVANDVLNDRLDRLRWHDIRDRFIRNVIVFGTGILKSWWDENWTDTSWVSVPAAGCTGCGAKIAYPGTEAVPCPACGGTLAPVELSEEESYGKDLMGEPLGAFIPKGGTNIEIITPFEYYPENQGVGVNPMTVRMHGICKVRSIDWVEERYPNLAEEIQPEGPEELLREHPLLGEWDYWNRYDYGYDSGVYDNHVRVYELYHDACARHPEGRSIVIIGKRQSLIAENGTLVHKSVDDKGRSAVVPRVMIQTALWKEREGEFWGKALPDDLVSPQNRINGIDAQVIEARERMGSPNLMIPADSDLEGPEFNAEYGLGKLFRYNVSPLNPNAKPEVFGSIVMPSGVNLERDRCAQDMTKIIGPADIEIGEAPRNITTTSGLQILGEQAERRRATRERWITSAIEQIWTHQMKLLWCYRVEPDTYEAATPDGTWEIKEYTKESIAGQTKVKVEKQAYIDKSVILREATREAQVDGLYDISSPLARKRILEARGLPTDINEDSNLQIDHAKRQWVDFVDEGKIPVIDSSIDNPNLRFQTLGTMLMQEEGKKIADEAGWDRILPMIAGWEEELARAEQQDQHARDFYGGEPDPQTAQELYGKAVLMYEEQKAQHENIARLAMQDPMGAMQLPPPPQPPPPPHFLPRQIELKIYGIWLTMIENKRSTQQLKGFYGFVTDLAMRSLKDPVEAEATVKNFLRFRAVFDGYRILAQKQQQQAAMQMAPPPQAPGSTPGAPGAPAA